jgi:glycine/D-amino acid oxidase-like deaminating enzyme
VSSDPVWEDGDWTPLPTLDGDVSADVCVVGLGGSGLTAVQELESRGATVVGLDAGSVGGGAAGRNGGFLLAGLARPYHHAVAQLGRSTAALLHRRTLEEMDRTSHTRRVVLDAQRVLAQSRIDVIAPQRARLVQVLVGVDDFHSHDPRMPPIGATVEPRQARTASCPVHAARTSARSRQNLARQDFRRFVQSLTV